MKNPDTSPRLRSTVKSAAPYPLNCFPARFIQQLGRELIYAWIAHGGIPLTGNAWESIFATCIGAQWKPSNIGLDDVVLGDTAWGAKSVTNEHPSQMTRVRLISGRNSPQYSYKRSVELDSNPDEIGQMILEIWNARVAQVHEVYRNIRTVVLIKGNDFRSFVIFELETQSYDPALFYWKWNKNGNLCGFSRQSDKQHFTWQPHGSQFTILVDVPPQNLLVELELPPPLAKDRILELVNFDPEWITTTQRG